MALTDKRRLFVEHYLQCWNATEAARRAGYSERSAEVEGSRLKTDPEIAARISERIAEVVMSADEVLIRLADQARGTIEDFIEVEVDADRIAELEDEYRRIEELRKKGDLIDSIRAELEIRGGQIQSEIHRLKTDPYRLDLPKAKQKDKLKIVKGLKPTQYGIGLELYDAQAALVHIGRHHQLFTDNVNHGGDLVFKIYKDLDTDEV